MGKKMEAKVPTVQILIAVCTNTYVLKKKKRGKGYK